MSNEYSIVYSSEARNDIKEIYSYIAFELMAMDAATRQINRITKAIRSLSFMPLRYPIVSYDPWKSMKMHKALVDNFIVFYTVDDANMNVAIIRIVYGGRDIQSIASRTRNN